MVNLDSSFVQIWQGPQPKCYIPSPKAIGLLNPEKMIFKEFLPYMGMVAILVMWPVQLVQILANLSYGVFIWNLSSIGLVVSEETMF